MSDIKNLRLLKSATVLADRSLRSESCDFRRFNLVYGFNASGKTTLSRLFLALQKGRRHEHLPEDCTFEIEMADGTAHKCPDQLTGLEQRVCVFNADFMEENLQWAKGRANPVFYIGREQADLAQELKRLEELVPLAQERCTSKDEIASTKKNAFNLHKRDQARTVSTQLRQAGRRYEAPQLIEDYQSLDFSDGSVISAEALENLAEISARSAPPPKVSAIQVSCDTTEAMLTDVEQLVAATIGTAVIADVERHPSMVPWMKLGHDYHTAQGLDTCLHCAGPISEERRRVLTAAFNDRFSAFTESIETAIRRAQAVEEAFTAALRGIPEESHVSPALQAGYRVARSDLAERIEAVMELVRLSRESLLEKRATPTAVVEITLPQMEERKEVFESLRNGCLAVNRIIDGHNRHVDDFARHQDEARKNIRRHFLADGAVSFHAARQAVLDSETAENEERSALQQLRRKIEELKTKVREHGPAAATINKLVKSYLGHSELTISAIAEGYELHRHGRQVRGSPSEGEKTAIALCYFLATLESDGRKLSDLIVVIDDPVSSLDTKAMNFACALIHSRLAGAAQLFVLTHNQHCMNEFKKRWKKMARATTPTAKLLYLDVVVPIDTGRRSSTIVEMSHLLREYDSEYQFLCEKVLEFEASGPGHSDYTFMMPNVIRRVLEVFLAFRIPSNGPLTDKIQMLCAKYSLDSERMMALERLAQVESHSDNIDDLVAHSSMTIEEAQDANAALLALMEAVDPMHLAGLRKYCKAD